MPAQEPGRASAPPRVEAMGGAGPSAGQGRSIEESFQIPTGYGDHRIVLMVKDPWWVYAYWEVQPVVMAREVKAEISPTNPGWNIFTWDKT